MANEDHKDFDFEIETVLERLNSYIEDLDEHINLERINMVKLFKEQIESLKGLWIQLHSYTARNSLQLVVREKIDAADQWLNRIIAVSEFENLDAHLNRLMENEDARFNEQQIFVANRFKELAVELKGRSFGLFKQARDEMAFFIKYWLKMTDTADIIKEGSSSMPDKDHNQINLEFQILVTQLGRYILNLDKYVHLEDAIIARTFHAEIRSLHSHGEVLPPAQRDDIGKKIDNGATEIIRDGRKRDCMSSSKSLTTRKIISRSVLVVDNDSKYLIVHCVQLILYGKITNYEMKVKADTHGNEAVDRIRKGASFDLIIMDLNRSTNGVEATKDLRAMGVKSRIIGFNSRSEPQQQAFMEAGLDGCFEKTLKADDIRELRALGVQSNIIGYTSSTAEAPYQQQTFMEAGLNSCFQNPMTLEIIAHFLLNPITNN